MLLASCLGLVGCRLLAGYEAGDAPDGRTADGATDSATDRGAPDLAIDVAGDASAAPIPTLAKLFGDSNAQRATAVLGDGKGGAWIAGHYSNSFAFDGEQSSGSGVFLVHVDATGALVAPTSSSMIAMPCTGGTARIVSLVRYGSGFWVVGQLNGTLSSPAGSVTRSPTDVFAFRLSDAGAAVGGVTLFGGKLSYYRPEAAVSDGAQGLWIAGHYDGSANVYEGTSSSNSGGTGAFVLHINGAGVAVYDRGFGGSGSDRVSAATSDGSGGVWIGGSHSNNALLNGTIYSAPALGAAFVQRIAANGAQSTVIPLNASDQSVVTALASDSQKRLWAAGNFAGTLSTSEGPLKSQSQVEAFLVRLDGAKRTIETGVRLGNSAAATSSSALTLDGSGDLWLSGTLGGATDTMSTAADGTPVVLAKHGSGAFVLRTSDQGKVDHLWIYETLSSPCASNACRTAQALEGTLLWLVGHANQPVDFGWGGLQSGYGSEDGFLLRLQL